VGAGTETANRNQFEASANRPKQNRPKQNKTKQTDAPPTVDLGKQLPQVVVKVLQPADKVDRPPAGVGGEAARLLAHVPVLVRPELGAAARLRAARRAERQRVAAKVVPRHARAI
jgi:hypothetical protein